MSHSRYPTRSAGPNGHSGNFNRSGEEPVQEPGVDQYNAGEEEKCPRSLDNLEVAKDRRNTKRNDPGVEAHAQPTERLGRHSADELSSYRDTDQYARQDLRDQLDRRHCKQASAEIRNSRKRRLGKTYDTQRSAELAFLESLVVQ